MGAALALGAALGSVGGVVESRAPAQTIAVAYLPIEAAPLDRLGYGDQVLRGRQVSAEFFFPGPGEFTPDSDVFIDVDYVASPLLAPDSTLTLLWNGIPFTSQVLKIAPPNPIAVTSPVPTRVSQSGTPGVSATSGTSVAAAARQRLTVTVPRERLDPEVNRLQVQAFLKRAEDYCSDDDDPARSLTIFSSTQLRYTYTDRNPHPVAVIPDLGRYPEPFFRPNAPQPPAVRFILPDAPSSAEWTAALRIAAQLGNFAAPRGVRIEYTSVSDLERSDPTWDHLIFVGRSGQMPPLALLASPVKRVADGTFLEQDRTPVAPGTGVVFEAPSPWNSGRMALAVTGTDDAAVERAGLALAGRGPISALRGGYALLLDAAAPPAAAQSARRVALSDLGRADRTFTGPGQYRVTFPVDVPALAARTTVPFDVVLSHSALLDRVRSSVRVLINGVPVASVGLRDLTPERATRRVDLPAAALRPGANSVDLEVTLRLSPASLPAHALGERFLCIEEPRESAWAVVHNDSQLTPPDADAVGPVTLASYPYPFLHSGRLDETTVIVPDQVGNGGALLRLVADLGGAANAEVLLLRAVRAAEWAPGGAARDMVLWGLPADNPLLTQIQDRLSIRVDPGQQLVLTREMQLAVRRVDQLGVVEVASSPWAPGRAVLVVTGTDAAGLPLAVEALRQGNLSGSAALVSRAEPPPALPGRTPPPQPLAVGGPAPVPVQVSTFRSRESADALRRRTPYSLYVALLVAVAALLVASRLAYAAVSPLIFGVLRKGPPGT